MMPMMVMNLACRLRGICGAGILRILLQRGERFLRAGKIARLQRLRKLLEVVGACIAGCALLRVRSIGA